MRHLDEGVKGGEELDRVITVSILYPFLLRLHVPQLIYLIHKGCRRVLVNDPKNMIESNSPRQSL